MSDLSQIIWGTLAFVFLLGVLTGMIAFTIINKTFKD
jgi:hypothetical protein